MRKVVASIAAAFGPEEILLIIALLMVAGGCWFVWWPAALIVPGAVLLWLALPSRQPFVYRAPVTPPKATRRPQ